MLWVIIPAVLFVIPLWVRNVNLYGAWDILGLHFHDTVVVGQQTTAEFLAKNGSIAYSERAMTFTFRSFWGAFGWLSVFMDSRIYLLLLVFTGIVLCGLLWSLARFISGRPETDLDRFQFWILGFFTVFVLAVFASYAWYNIKFVQHQGRYFLWGLLPISVFAALGWREVMQPLQGKVTGFLLGLLAGSMLLVSHDSTLPGSALVLCNVGACRPALSATFFAFGRSRCYHHWLTAGTAALAAAARPPADSWRCCACWRGPRHLFCFSCSTW